MPPIEILRSSATYDNNKVVPFFAYGVHKKMWREIAENLDTILTAEKFVWDAASMEPTSTAKAIVLWSMVNRGIMLPEEMELVDNSQYHCTACAYAEHLASLCERYITTLGVKVSMPGICYFCPLDTGVSRETEDHNRCCMNGRYNKFQYWLGIYLWKKTHRKMPEQPLRYLTQEQIANIKMYKMDSLLARVQNTANDIAELPLRPEVEQHEIGVFRPASNKANHNDIPGSMYGKCQNCGNEIFTYLMYFRERKRPRREYLCSNCIAKFREQKGDGCFLGTGEIEAWHKTGRI